MTDGPSITVRSVGRERQPLVVIDGFTRDPDGLRAYAAASRFEPADRHYPGIRAALPPDYLRSVQPVIATVLDKVFGLRRSARLLDASFSIVTAPPHTLGLEQRLPHVDAIEPDRIALIHYLSPGGGDGTAFYRHRSTGFETIDQTRAPDYYARLNAELRERGSPPPAYIAGDTELFERTALAEARYDRALIYRSAVLHSGAISPGATLSPDPATGRLTVTAFLSAT